MPFSIRSILTLGFYSQTHFKDDSPSKTTQSPLGDGYSCPIDSPLSCHNQTTAPDSCCFVYPGGQLLQTQFWDTDPAVGPSDSWTLHGLWPDLCDGTYPTYCHSTPTFYNITSILRSTHDSSLLESMEKYWLPDRGTNEHFWEHEWNKHATCINTLSSSCYDSTSYIAGQEVFDFFTHAVNLFKQLDTYTALKECGIVPSKHRTYKKREIEEALRTVTGREVVIRCDRRQLREVWYSFNVKGSLQGGQFVAAEPAGKEGRSGCPRRGIKYLPKKKHSYGET